MNQPIQMIARSRYILILFVYAGFLLISSCSSDMDYVKKQQWIYKSGCRDGGVFGFSDGYVTLHQDTIVFGNTPLFLILTVNKRNDEMCVKNINTNCETIFVSTNHFK